MHSLITWYRFQSTDYPRSEMRGLASRLDVTRLTPRREGESSRLQEIGDGEGDVNEAVDEEQDKVKEEKEKEGKEGEER